MHRFALISGLMLIVVLAGCGGPAQQQAGMHAPLECVPFARALSGVNLRGDAGDWWWKAAGQYERGLVPRVGSVMVFAAAPSLRRGHVAVVSRVLSRDEVLVTQANWVHHRVTIDQLVRDVSPYGDWSLVRVWWPPSGTLGGTAFPVHGFIHSNQSASHERIVRAVPGAVRMALNN